MLATRLKGDTIIEVMVAVTIFSLVAVGSMVLMNNGISMSQRSLEVTLVRQQIDAQVEMLRYVHIQAKEDPKGSYRATWDSLLTQGLTDEPFQLINQDQCPSRINNGVALVAKPSGGVGIINLYNASPATYAKIADKDNEAQGLSIQLTKVDGGKAYDAYVQACWYSPGLDRPMTIGTIVRLYDASV